jgi:hypothetical protein
MATTSVMYKIIPMLSYYNFKSNNLLNISHFYEKSSTWIGDKRDEITNEDGDCQKAY